MAKKESTGTTTYSVNMPHQAAWIVYINGIEVPVNSVNVEFGVWSIPTAQIRLVPHVILQRIGHEDRLQVEIYYLDLFFDPAFPKMCFMGEFEVVGWSYQTTSAGRFLQLDCRSHLKILEQLRFYYMSSLADMAKGFSAPTATDASVMTIPMVTYPYSLFRQGLVPDTANPDAFITSPFEFVRNLLKALTDPVDLSAMKDTDASEGMLPRSASGVAGRNFFGRWMEMVDFRRRWAALPFFDDEQAKLSEGCFPIVKALTSTEVLGTIQEKIGNSVGEAGTAWELLQRVYGAMYMEILAMPAPAAVQLESKTNLIMGYFKRRGGGKDDANYGGVASYLVKPQCIFGIPPACNIIFPSMIRTYATTENYERQPTRVYLGEAYVSNLLSSGASGDMQTLANELLVTGYPDIVRQRMQLHRENPGLSTRNFLIYPEELYKGPVSKHMNAPTWLYMLEKTGQTMETSTVGGTTYARGRGTIASLERAVPAFGPIVKEAAKDYKLPEEFVWGVIGLESGYNPKSRHPKSGAGGLMQTMQATFVSSYTRALGKNPKLPALGNHGPPRKVPKGGSQGGTRTVWNDTIYNDIWDPQKGLYAGIDELAELVKKYGATNFSVEELNPKNVVPSLAQCVLIGYNGGPKHGDRLFKQRNEYLAKPESQRDPAIFDKGWTNWEDASGVRNPEAHWRIYSSKGYRFQKAYIAYNQLVKPGETASAPSSPVAPKKEVVKDKENPPGSPAQTGVNAATAKNSATPAFRATGADRNLTKSLQGIAARQSAAFQKAQASALKAATTATSAPPASSTAAPSGTGVAGTITATASVFNATEDQTALGDLFNIYAKYEYFRSRFETRSATVSLAFNPYIVPGFSAVVLDNIVSGFHSIGYVNSVSHSFSAQGDMQTTVVLSYVRTLPEFLKLLVTGSNDISLQSQLNAGYDVGPTEVIPEVATVFQNYIEADNFYQNVLYPGVSKGTPLSFNASDLLVMVDMEGEPVSATPDTTENANSWVPDKGLYTRPTPAYEACFSSYDAAMTFASRPVATLQQMIELRHGKTLKELLAEKKKSPVQGPIDSFTDENKSARFYARIYNLMQPGPELDYPAIEAITNTGPIETSTLSGNWQIIAAEHNIPESRYNWDRVLIKYRNAVRGSEAAALL
jgi:hypothetical protein